MSDTWFEGKNSSVRVGNWLDNKTWGFHLKNVPLARDFRDKEMFSYIDLLNAILSTTNRREQLAIAAYVWNGDAGYGSAPNNDQFFSGNDL